ncbi:MAG: hypothetical protein JJ896_07470 [Rhodothermales bacterium]|nr:hypothetical protein [Rhodothermales bacterium]MBO6779477.1 hypothetical protein [Rhodothermales bacterium]
MSRLLILAVVVLLPAGDLWGQVRRVELAADSSETRVIDGRRVTELFNVRLSEDTARLRAERGIDYGTGDIHFYRNVRMIDQGDTLTADEVRYNRFTKLGRATGNVRLGDGEVVVNAPEGDFDLRAHRADFRAGVRMVDSVSVLTSENGSYWTEEKRAEFAGLVRLDSDDTDVLADSLTYLRGGRRSDARGNVLIARRGEDTETLILGDRAVNDDSLGTGEAYGNVLVVRVSADSTASDTLYIAAEIVRSFRDDIEEWTAATGSVQVWDTEYAALSDSVYQMQDLESRRNWSRLFGAPFIWVGESQVSGDTVAVAGVSGSVDSLRVRGNAFVAQRDTMVNRIQQLKGRTLQGRFADGDLQALEVTPNAEAVYFNRDEADSLNGAMQVTADRIRFLFEGEEISDLRVYQDVNGTYFPLELIPSELRLDGLNWRPDARPDPLPFRQRLQEALARFQAQPSSDS